MNSVQVYQKKPVRIEAVQWDGTAEHATYILDWILRCGRTANYMCDPNKDGSCPGDEELHWIQIQTLEGDMRADKNDWIIRGIKGEFYPCKPDIFDGSYDEVGV